MELLADSLVGGLRDGPVEKMRDRIRQPIRYAVGLLAREEPAIASHLDATVRLGYVCRYSDTGPPFFRFGTGG